MAELLAYASVEFALRWRFGLRSKLSKQDRKLLLARAVRSGWIRADGFRRFREAAAQRVSTEEVALVVTGREPDPSRDVGEWHVGMLAEILPEFRRNLAHGSTILAPSGKRTLALGCDLIKQPFPPKAEGTS